MRRYPQCAPLIAAITVSLALGWTVAGCGASPRAADQEVPSAEPSPSEPATATAAIHDPSTGVAATTACDPFTATPLPEDQADPAVSAVREAADAADVAVDPTRIVVATSVSRFLDGCRPTLAITIPVPDGTVEAYVGYRVDLFEGEACDETPGCSSSSQGDHLVVTRDGADDSVTVTSSAPDASPADDAWTFVAREGALSLDALTAMALRGNWGALTDEVVGDATTDRGDG